MRPRLLGTALLSALLFSSAAIGATGETVRRYLLHGRPVQLIRNPTEHLTLSSACKARDCDAYRALDRASLEGLEQFLAGGAEPGAVICRRALHARAEVARDEAGNEIGLCEFKDGSLVGTGTLAYHASRARAKDGR